MRRGQRQPSWMPCMLAFCIIMTNTMALSTKSHHTGKPTIPWIVRSPTPHDKPAIESVFRASYGALLPHDYDADLLHLGLPKICQVRDDLLTSSTWYVVEHPTQPHGIVGCGGWTPESPMTTTNPQTCPHLRHFATHPQHTRQGIGRVLWDRIWKDWCEYYDDHHQQLDNNNKRPDMEVFSTLTARPFYGSLGFETVEEILIPLAEDCLFPSILMRRPDSS